MHSCSLCEKFIGLVGVIVSQIDICHFDSGTLVDDLSKYRPLALLTNQSCELNETSHTYNSIVALLIA